MSSEHPVVLRSVTAADVDLLFEWANDPRVRANSLSSSPISRAEHEKWFEDTLTSTTRRQYIAMSEEQLIGQIRFDKADDAWEVGVSIVPAVRGKGLASCIISCGLGRLKKDEPEARKIRAIIRPDNVASIKAFRRAGFTGDDMIERANQVVMVLEYDMAI